MNQSETIPTEPHLRRAVGALKGKELLHADITPLDKVYGATGATEHEHIHDGGRAVLANVGMSVSEWYHAITFDDRHDLPSQSLVHNLFEGQGLPATLALIGGEDPLALGIIDTVAE